MPRKRAGMPRDPHQGATVIDAIDWFLTFSGKSREDMIETLMEDGSCADVLRVAGDKLRSLLNATSPAEPDPTLERVAAGLAAARERVRPLVDKERESQRGTGELRTMVLRGCGKPVSPHLADDQRLNPRCSEAYLCVACTPNPAEPASDGRVFSDEAIKRATVTEQPTGSVEVMPGVFVSPVPAAEPAPRVPEDEMERMAKAMRRELLLSGEASVSLVGCRAAIRAINAARKGAR